MPPDPLSTADVAALAGVHRDTLLRWLRQGLIPEPPRDRRGWRVFSREEAQAVVDFSNGGGSPSDAAPEVTRLRSADWDFRGAKTDYLTHGLHPYPAKFIPQIPNLLIQELSSVGDRVCDIFCGSGTTLVEALTLKRHAVGVDANPLAALIARAKTTRLSEAEIEVLVELAERSCKVGESISVYIDDEAPLLFSPPTFKSAAPRPGDKQIGGWFDAFMVEELAELLSWCRSLPTPASQDAALASLSAIIVAVSRQDSDTRYVRRSKPLKPGDGFRRFSAVLQRNATALAELTDIVEARFRCKVYNADALEAPEIGTVDLVVCSPPYPNAYSYHLYHRTRMAWLGMDQPAFKAVEIGSHRKYSTRGASRATAGTFQEEMRSVFRWLADLLPRGRFACFVIGDSVLNGEVVDNSGLLSSAALPFGFRPVERLARKIDRTRAAFNPQHGTARKREHILIMKHG